MGAMPISNLAFVYIQTQTAMRLLVCVDFHNVIIFLSVSTAFFRVISSSEHRIFHGLVSPSEYYMLSLLRDSITNISMRKFDDISF